MNPPIKFDKNGLLQPHRPIPADLETMEEIFVKRFPKSTTRRQLFENYQRYVYRFQDEVFPWFEQWVNGSFVTMKENPKDIDLVTFVDHKVYDLRKKTLDRFWSFNLEGQGLDAYIVAVFPENHPEFQNFVTTKDRWLLRYVENRGLNRKGFLEINFGKSID